jgi:hypothetical protein
LSVEVLSNNLRRFRIVNGSQILLHCGIVISFLIQIISVPAVYGVLLMRVNADLLRQVDGQDIEIALVKNLESLLEALLSVPINLSNISIFEIRFAVCVPFHRL